MKIFPAKPQQLNLDGMSQQMWFMFLVLKLTCGNLALLCLQHRPTFMEQWSISKAKPLMGKISRNLGEAVYLPGAVTILRPSACSFKPCGQPRNLAPTFSWAPELICGTLAKKTLPGGMLSGLLGSQNDTSLGRQHSSSDWDLLAGET